MQTTTLRKAAETDVPALYTALQAMVAEQKIEHRFTLTEPKLSDALFAKNTGGVEVLCATDKDKILGFVLYSETNRNFDLFDGPGLYVHDIFVYPEFRRQGIGRKLMDHIIEVSKDRKYSRIDWVQFKENTIGDHFFKAVQGSQSVDYIDYKRIVL